VHLEEDTAKLTHVTGEDGLAASLIDVNRSGVPLMEVVGEPDISTPEEAVAFGLKLRNVMRWLGISTANMQDGALRIDANVSVWPADHEVGDVKVEVKNMNSFRALGRALAFEAERQTRLWEQGLELTQETRGWVEGRGETVPQRTKEYAHDYRYFPEPDLPPLQIGRDRVEELRKRLPTLPDAVEARLVDELGVSPTEAAELVGDRALAEYALAVIEQYANGGETVTWILQDVRRVLNARRIATEAIPVPPAEMAALLEARQRGEISSSMASEVLDEMFASGQPAAEIIQARGRQISDADELSALARQVIAENPKAVDDYRQGKQRAIQFLMGQVMRHTRGKANPGVVTELLRAELDG
jgi:aspartyl-tRNA(Asn)/glutamyl-tRNA(Gln) amidotransferase subunit B